MAKKTKKKNPNNLNARKNLDTPGVPTSLTELVLDLNAVASKDGQRVTISNKDNKVVLPSMGTLPFDVFLKFFDDADAEGMTAEKVAKTVAGLSRYFAKNNSEFAEFIKGLNVQQVSAVIVSWLGSQGQLPELGK